MRCVPAVFALGAAIAGWPGEALADGEVSEAVRAARALYESGALAEASAAVEAILLGDGATAQEVGDALELDALIHITLGELPTADRALRWLAVITPGAVLGDEFPPDARERFALHRAEAGTPSITLAARVGGTRAIATAEVRDPVELVREVRVHGRADRGAWTSATGALELDVGDAGRAFFYAVAIGPGGVVLASAGSEADPRVVVVGATRDDGGDDGDDGPPWLLIGAGGAAAVLATVVIAILVAGGDPEGIEVTPPMFPTGP